MILIVFATETEAAPFKSLARRMAGTEVDVLISGIGQVNAAHALTAYFERHNPSRSMLLWAAARGRLKAPDLISVTSASPRKRYTPIPASILRMVFGP